MPDNLRAAMPLDVTWLGKCSRLFAGREVLYCGADTGDLDRAVRMAEVIAVDPGDPAGVACFPHDRGYPITLHEVDPAELAQSFVESVGKRAVVCETPLHGAIRVYDTAPWRLRGFLEFFSSAVGQLFYAAQVDNLKAGKNLAKVNTRGVSRHAKDALAYGAVAITLNSTLAARLEA